jgi:hypothetical protein
MTDDNTLLPYAGTSGWSGSDTSRERAQREDTDGTTTERQQAVLTFLAARGWYGATVNEVVRGHPGWHHGHASGALSVLHKAGRIARLGAREDRRQQCAPYVTLDNVGGRETSPYRPNRPSLAAYTTDELWDELGGRDGWWNT